MAATSEAQRRAASVVAITRARMNAFTPTANDPMRRLPPPESVVVQVPPPSAARIARAAAVPAGPSLVDQVSAMHREAFPTVNYARVQAGRAIDDSVAKGDYARAAGAALTGAVALPAGLVTDVVGRPALAAARGIGSFVGGVLGSRGDETVRAPTAAAAAPAPAAPIAAVESALAQGRTAAPAITPSDALGSYITNVLQNGATIREAQALGGFVPALAKPGQSTKNAVLGQTAALSQSIFEQQTAALEAAAKAGTIDAAQLDIGKQKATAAYFARNGGLVGFDPTKLAQAALLQGADEEE